MIALERREDIWAAQRALQRLFRSGAESFRDVKMGYQGGAVMGDAHWHEDLGIWGSLNDGPLGDEKGAGRFWNVFGTQDPSRHGNNLSITCEANPSHEGINRRCAGLFARDDDSELLLLHRGKLNGMTMWAFWQVYDGDEVSCWDGRSDFRCAVVARIGTPQIATEIAAFTKEAERVKQVVRGR